MLHAACLTLSSPRGLSSMLSQGQDRAAVKLLDMCDPNKERPCTHLQADEAGGLHSDVPSLESLCKTAVVRGMDSWSVCGALALVDMVAPGLDEIAPALVGFLARNLRQALAVAPDSFQALPAALLAELLGNPCLVSFAYPACQPVCSVRVIRGSAHAAGASDSCVQQPLVSTKPLTNSYWLSVWKATSRLLVTSPQECSERFVFDAVMQWAYNSQDPREPLAQSVADVENLLLLIRFPLMSQTDLEVRAPSTSLLVRLPILSCATSVAMPDHAPIPEWQSRASCRSFAAMTLLSGARC